MLTLPCCGWHFHISPACLHATPAFSDKHRYPSVLTCKREQLPQKRILTYNLVPKHISRIIPIHQNLCAALLETLNNLCPHLTRRLSSDFSTPVPSSQIKDPVWKLLLWNSTRLMSVDVSGQGFKLSSWISSSKPPTLKQLLHHIISKRHPSSFLPAPRNHNTPYG